MNFFIARKHAGRSHAQLLRLYLANRPHLGMVGSLALFKHVDRLAPWLSTTDSAQCGLVMMRITNVNFELLCFLLVDPIAQQASIQ